MTRPPTIAALRKEARRVFGPCAKVRVNARDNAMFADFAAALAWSGTDMEEVRCDSASTDTAKCMLLTCLRALPSHAAPTPKKRKGAKR